MKTDFKIDFKTLKMMELRSSPGEVLDRVARDGEVFVVERNGQPKACLVPVHFLLPDIPPERIAKELDKLRERGEEQKLAMTINEHKELVFSFLETSLGDRVVLSVVLPHGYPSSAPRVYVDPLAENVPRRWEDGSLSVFGVTTTWSSRTHDVFFALTAGRHWLKCYTKWRKTGEWPKD